MNSFMLYIEHNNNTQSGLRQLANEQMKVTAWESNHLETKLLICILKI